jgi:hypothetical protein
VLPGAIDSEAKPSIRNNLYIKKRERSITPIIQNAPSFINKTCDDVYQIEIGTTKRLISQANKFTTNFKREIANKQSNIKQILSNPPLPQEDSASMEEKSLCTKINQIRAKNKYKSRPSNSRYDSLPLQEDSVGVFVIRYFV